MSDRLNVLVRRAAWLVAGAAVMSSALAAGGGGSGEPSAAADVSRELATAQAAIERQDWTAAITELERARHKDFQNAEVYNLLGYSLRKSGKLDEALKHYRSALRLDPKHKGAHEYIGEAYLAVRQPDKAREHLAALKKICGESCEQYQDLARSLASYQAASR